MSEIEKPVLTLEQDRFLKTNHLILTKRNLKSYQEHTVPMR